MEYIKMKNFIKILISLLFIIFLIILSGCRYEVSRDIYKNLLNTSEKNITKKLIIPEKITFPHGTNGEILHEMKAVWNLFDGNTDSSYFSDSSKLFEIHINSEYLISGFRIYGNAENILNIYSDGTRIPFESSSISSREDAWHSLVLSDPVETNDLIFQISGDIGEVEILGHKKKPDSKKDSLVSDLTLPSVPSNFIAEKGSIAAVEFYTTVDPRIFNRAVLKYKSNQFSPVSVMRKINDKTWAGGFPTPNDDSYMKSHEEEINPKWLSIGKNIIKFKSDDANLAIRNVRIEFHARDEYSFVESVSESGLFDEDVRTSENISISNGDVLTHFSRTVTPYKLKFHIPGSQLVKTKLSVLKNGTWSEIPGFEIDFSIMQNGWNSVDLPEGIVCESIRIIPSGKVKFLQLDEVKISASPVGCDIPRIVVSYPKNGEFFGRTAYIQGFVTPGLDNNNISIEGIADTRYTSDGSFSFSLSKDQTKYAGQKDESPWYPVIKAVSNSVELEHELNLYMNYSHNNNTTNTFDNEDETTSESEIDSDGTFRTILDPQTSKSISFQNVRMNIPAGAVDKVTEITITPLKKEDLEGLDPGMINVTFPSAGYRFLPHGKFKKPIEIYFHYARELLRKGQKDNDIYMFYFDENTKKWKRLDRVNVQKDIQLVRSVTDHFTDIINATLSVPEHPNPLSYNPNSIKTLKSGNPSAGINMIAPPQGTNMGDASVSYPIVLPKGRGRMQPGFSVGYSSGGQNGMMGQGWDIVLDSITINTMFGVPRYNGDEQYLLGSMKLVPDPKKTGFYRPKAEGTFHLIQRLGSDPGNYHWQITDKNGTKYLYGKSPDARLSNPGPDNNNIFQWFLEKTIDVHGNNVKYYYMIDDVPGVLPGRGIYLDRVTYTGTADLDGLYSVYFSYDQDRPDMIMSCLSGFKMITRLKLNAVDVFFEDMRIRRYEYKYITGAFDKLLLKEIQTYGEDGSDGKGYFYKHSFEYYNEIGYDASGTNKSVNGFTETEKEYDADARSSATESKIGTYLGGGGSFDLFGGYAPPLTGGRKGTSIGVRTGSSGGISRGKNDLQDVNGDGLLDRLSKNSYILNKTPWDSKNVVWGESLPVSLPGTSLEDNVNWSATFGGSAYVAGAGIFSDYNMGETTSKRYLMDMNADYRVDLITNGDVKFNNADVIDGKEVKAKFEDTSNIPLGASGISADITDIPDDPEWKQDQDDWKKRTAEENLADIYYKDDPVRMWQAPYDGFVSISGNVSLFTGQMNNDIQFDEEVKSKIDGVMVSIQKEKDVLWFKEITPLFEKNEETSSILYKPLPSTVTPSNVNAIRVDKGERIFFRVSSINDGSYDVVEWDPVIEYINIDNTVKDENGFSLYRFHASEDFTLASTDVNMSAIYGGTIGITGNVFKKKITTDDIFVKIIISKPELDENGMPTGSIVSKNEVYSQKISWKEHEETSPVLSVSLDGLAVDKDDIIECKLFAESTVDWTQVSWKPIISYERIKYEKHELQTDPGTDHYTEDENGNPLVTTTIVEVDADEFENLSRTLPVGVGQEIDNSKSSTDFFAPVTVSNYPVIENGPVRAWEVTPEHTHGFTVGYSVMFYQEFDPFSGIVRNIEGMPEGYEADLSFAVKKKNILTGENELVARSNCIIRNKNNGPEIIEVDEDGYEIESFLAGNSVDFKLNLEDLNKGDNLFFIFTTESNDLFKYINFSEPVIEGSRDIQLRSILCRKKNDAEALLFGGGFRNWYFGRWNGEQKTDGENKLNTNMMVLSERNLEASSNLSEENIKEIIKNSDNTDNQNFQIPEMTDKFNAVERLKAFSPMITDANYYWANDSSQGNIKKWQKKAPSQAAGNNMLVYVGNDKDTWISSNMMSATRIIKKNLSEITGGSNLEEAKNSTQSNFDSELNFQGRNRGITKKTKNNGFIIGIDAYGSGNVSKNFMKTNADMFDFNGDRYPDIVKNGYVRFTNKDGSLGQSKRIEGFSYIRESDSLNYTLGISWSVDGTLQKTSYMANGRIVGQNADFSTPGISFFSGFGDTKTKNDFVDINGDGLPDRVYDDGTVRLNLGYKLGPVEKLGLKKSIIVNKTANVNPGGNIGFSTDKGAYGGGLFMNISQAAVESCYMDINGDGLQDLIEKPLYAIPIAGIIPKDDNFKVRFNTGKGFTEEYNWTGGTKDLPVSSDISLSINTGANFSIKIPLWAIVPLGTIIINPGIGTNFIYGKAEVRMKDINGDGYPDQIYKDADGIITANFNRTGRTNLLKKVNRPLGGSFEIAYNRNGNTTDMPFSKWVMAKVTVNDGMNDTEGGVHNYINTYKYEDGFYDRIEREFYGYRSLIHKSGQGKDTKEVISTYLNEQYYEKGLMIKSILKDSEGKIYTKDKNEYLNHEICDGSKFTYLHRKQSNYYEGTTANAKSEAPMYTSQEYKYDEYGNVIEFIYNGDPATVKDDLITTIEYDLKPDKYIMNKPHMIKITGHDGSILRLREGIYDNKGNLREQRVLLDGVNYATTNIDYYSNGTMKTVISPQNERGQRYYTTYQYDPKIKIYPERIEDSFGLYSAAKYDYRYGHVISTSDTNNNLMLYSYDKYGRIIRIWATYDIGKGRPTVEYYYDHEARPAYAKTLNKEYCENFKTIDTVVFVDGLGRVIQKQKTNEVNNVVGRTISGKIVFDSLGRKVAIGQPRFADDLSFNYFNAAPLNSTEFSLDLLDRKTEIKYPDSTSNIFEYGFKTDAGVNLFSTLSIDRNGERRETLTDIRGLIKKKTEYAPDSEDVITSYDYDALKQIVKVTDHDGNMIFVDYDLGGRRLSIHDPDAGNQRVFYDNAGNMIRRVTPNLRNQEKSIRYTYNFNRLIRINYPNMPDVNYAYGKPGDMWNRAGRITVVDNGNMKEELFYGCLGETAKSVRTINTSKGSRAYTTRYEWDNLGKMRKLFYPDGEVLSYEYNSGGLLKSARSWHGSQKNVYVKEIQYDEFLQKKKMVLGNNVTSEYLYNPYNRRLKKLLTKDAEGNVYQNIEYKFDGIGNVKERNNHGFITEDSVVKNSVQTYEYDNLHRLVGSEGSYDHERWVPVFDKRVNSYTTSISYNSIGNILTKNQVNTGFFPGTGETLNIDKTTYNYSYNYDTVKPHAVTSAGPKSFKYDANGNMTHMVNSQTGMSRQLTWDDENRLLITDDSVEENHNVTRFSYDFSGTRVVKKGIFGEVVYVSSNYTVRNDTLIGKHIFAGSTRVASKMVMRENSGESETGNNNEGTYFYHGDHLGSSSVVTNKDGRFHEHLEYFPYGETWIHEKADKNAGGMPYKFTAKEEDKETGLYYYGARYYDPVISRWASVDPAHGQYLPGGSSGSPSRLPGGGGIYKSINLDNYHYASNNPVNYIDPDGRVSLKKALVFTLAAAATARASSSYTWNPVGIPKNIKRVPILNMPAKDVATPGKMFRYGKVTAAILSNAPIGNKLETGLAFVLGDEPTKKGILRQIPRLVTFFALRNPMGSIEAMQKAVNYVDHGKDKLTMIHTLPEDLKNTIKGISNVGNNFGVSDFKFNIPKKVSGINNEMGVFNSSLPGIALNLAGIAMTTEPHDLTLAMNPAMNYYGGP
jgi:RHS repeat-associated protein